MNLVYADVPPLDFVDEMAALFPAHYEELCTDKTYPFEPDWDLYKLFASNNMLRVITVRADSELIGYMVFNVRPHLHYKSCLTAFEDLYYLRPDMRQGRIGIRMFKYAEEVLARIGVQKIIVHTKVHMDNSRLLEYLGYSLTDKIFAKTVVPQ